MTVFDERRTRISEMIDGLGGEASGNAQDVKAVSKALLIGDRKEISSTLREKFNRAGVGHLLAISGLHIGIVATVTFAIFRWIVSVAFTCFMGRLDQKNRRHPDVCAGTGLWFSGGNVPFDPTGGYHGECFSADAPL